MSSPVRLRDGRERRQIKSIPVRVARVLYYADPRTGEAVNVEERDGTDRRTNLDLAARIDAIVAQVRDEEGREQHKLLEIISSLREENARLKADLAAAVTDVGKWARKAGFAEGELMMLRKGAGAGEVSGE